MQEFVRDVVVDGGAPQYLLTPDPCLDKWYTIKGFGDVVRVENFSLKLVVSL